MTFDLDWRTRVKLLHKDWHYARLDLPRFELPGIQSVSFIKPGDGWRHRSSEFPRQDLVKAIDRRAGWDERAPELLTAIPQSFGLLAEFNRRMWQVVQATCVEGSARPMQDGRFWHPAINEVKEWEDFAGGRNRALEWQFSGWEFVTMTLTEGEVVRSAWEGGEIGMREGYAWLTERGLA